MYYLIGSKPRKEPKQVIFSDGIRPGGDLTDLTEPADVIPVYRRIGRKRVEKTLPGNQTSELLAFSILLLLQFSLLSCFRSSIWFQISLFIF